MVLRDSTGKTYSTPLWRLGRAGLLAIIAVAAILGLGVASSERAEALSCTGPIGSGEIRVVLVVDASDLGGGTSATCLVVPAATTGSQLLSRRSSEIGRSAPRYGSSGLLCAIDGAPSTGCGERSAGGFEYWAYFSGSSGSWAYGNFNPFTKRLVDGDIEGWRYVRGAGNGQDPPPRVSPSRSLFPELATEVVPPLVTPAAPQISPPTPTTTVEQIVIETSATTAVVSDETVVVGDVALTSASSRLIVGRWLGIFGAAVLIVALAGSAWVRTRRSQ